VAYPKYFGDTSLWLSVSLFNYIIAAMRYCCDYCMARIRKIIEKIDFLVIF
jgi:hypothetical protein